MLKNFALIKPIGGVAVIGGTGITGYIYRKEIIDFWNSDNQTFLVQSTITGTEKDIDEYYCEFSNNNKTEVDEDCSILSINFTKEKFASAENIVNSYSETRQLKNNSFYKLIINKYKVKEQFTNNVSEIVLKTKDKAEIGKLKIISSMSKSTVEEPVDTWSGSKILVKADSSSFVSDNIASKLKCKDTTNNSSEYTCKIYKFNDLSNKHLFDFSKIKKITKFNEIQSSQYYVLDLNSTPTQTFDDAKLKNISIFNDSTAITKLTFVSKIFSNLKEDGTESENNQSLILSNNFGNNEFNKTYIIAKSESSTTDGFNSTERNYICKIDTNGSDENCEIIELKDNERNLEKITSAKYKPSDLKAPDKYYKILVNNDVISKITTWDETKKINIVDKTTTSTVYGKLKPLFLIEDGKLEKGKTDLLIATSKSVVSNLSGITINENTTYKCKVASTAEQECDVYFFNPEETLKTIVQDLSKQLEKPKATTNWKQNQIYLIHLKGSNKLDTSTLKTNNNIPVEVTVKIKTNSQDLSTLTVNFPLANKKFTSGNTNNLLVLK